MNCFKTQCTLLCSLDLEPFGDLSGTWGRGGAVRKPQSKTSLLVGSSPPPSLAAFPKSQVPLQPFAGGPDSLVPLLTLEFCRRFLACVSSWPVAVVSCPDAPGSWSRSGLLPHVAWAGVRGGGSGRLCALRPSSHAAPAPQVAPLVLTGLWALFSEPS